MSDIEYEAINFTVNPDGTLTTTIKLEHFELLKCSIDRYNKSINAILKSVDSKRPPGQVKHKKFRKPRLQVNIVNPNATGSTNCVSQC